jgi:2-polyprenyl-3-methyl-5-hydroxy-6-metoxy-1,4-benzoquinol methylase
MFGQTLDYLILSLFTHSRNAKTEYELNSYAAQQSHIVIEDANLRLKKLMERLEGNFPISDTLRYLDIGCGKGDITIALAKAGCKKVTGIDLVQRVIDQATLNAKQLRVDDHVEFICENIHNWHPLHQYDVILSHEALEHIENPQEFLQEVANLINPNGILVLAFGPLFHSPFGDHMDGFFRIHIPWRGVIFSEKAILRARRQCYRPTDLADRYQDVSGGLNLMRYSEFMNYVDKTGWEFSFLCINPQLKRIPFLYHLSNIIIQIPLVKDYFASSVYAILQRRSS